MQVGEKCVAVAVSGLLCVAAVAWAFFRDGAPNIAPHEFVAWGAIVVLSGITLVYAVSRFRTPLWWAGVLKPRGFKLDDKSQIGLDALAWWSVMGGVPGSLIVQLVIDKQRVPPVGVLATVLWVAVLATVGVIAWKQPDRLTHDR